MSHGMPAEFKNGKKLDIHLKEKIKMNKQLKKEVERLELAIRHGSANALPEDYVVRRVQHRKQIQMKRQIRHGFVPGQINSGQINQWEKTHA